ncbi:MAG: hypothetical protein JXR96_16220 [Deltaproteobacteria bacterium]|nr:hypothetical protein [Deltaproteobacteria bacterium]
MPVRRLESLEDARDAVWYEPDDPALWRTIRAVWELAARLCPYRFPPGVYRQRSIEESNQQRECWEQQRVELAGRRLQGGPKPEAG